MIEAVHLHEVETSDASSVAVLPAGWNLDELRSPRVFRGEVGSWHVVLWCDAGSGLVILAVFTV